MSELQDKNQPEEQLLQFIRIREPATSTILLSQQTVIKSGPQTWKTANLLHRRNVFMVPPRRDYRAANWMGVGETMGRGRNDRTSIPPAGLPIKQIYLYPLVPNFRQRCQAV